MRSDDVSERVRVLVAPSLEEAGLELFDVEYAGGVLKVIVDRPGGIDLDTISEATRIVSTVLDRESDVIEGRYLLEVSSPGIERPLRRPEHFRAAIGKTVVVKTVAGLRDPNAAAGLRDPNAAAGLRDPNAAAAEAERRVEGVLEAADDDGVVVAGRAIAYSAIERARTRFVWPTPQEKKRKAGAR